MPARWILISLFSSVLIYIIILHFKKVVHSKWRMYSISICCSCFHFIFRNTSLNFAENKAEDIDSAWRKFLPVLNSCSSSALLQLPLLPRVPYEFPSNSLRFVYVNILLVSDTEYFLDWNCCISSHYSSQCFLISTYVPSPQFLILSADWISGFLELYF